MSLLCKPKTPDEHGRIHDIAPSSSGLAYVGFSVHRLSAGQSLSRATGDREACIVLLAGQAKASAGGRDFGEIGQRASIFEGTPPFALYAPPGSDWSVTAHTDIELGIGTAPAKGAYPPSLITPEDIETATRGTGTNLRHVNPILMDDRDAAESLLITEVFTPAGHWSSYPPHKHDADDFPNETLLEETYYHRIDPPQGFAFQRVYTDDRSLDETMSVYDGDVVKVPHGYHPCAAAHGYNLYYLNVMAGPLRQWRFRNEPDHDWIANTG
ncbi:MAG: 5-deoxy-glucuronate isomerase [Rhodomicrobiaceae bacterium]